MPSGDQQSLASACLAQPSCLVTAERQVCMSNLPCLSLFNPFLTTLVQESGLCEVEMNN